MISPSYLSLQEVYTNVIPHCDGRGLNILSQVCKVFNQHIFDKYAERLKQFILMEFLSDVHFKLIKMPDLSKNRFSDRLTEYQDNLETLTTLDFKNFASAEQYAIDTLADIDENDLEKVVALYPKENLSEYLKTILKTASIKLIGELNLIDNHMTLKGCDCFRGKKHPQTYKGLETNKDCQEPYRHGWHPILQTAIYSDKWGYEITQQLPMHLFNGIKEGDVVKFSDNKWNYQLQCKGTPRVSFESWILWALDNPGLPCTIEPEHERQLREIFAEASKKYKESIGQ